MRAWLPAAAAALALVGAGLAVGAVKDPTFGLQGAGSVVLSHDVWSLSTDGSGRILAVGTTRNLPAAGFIGITRLRASGAIDATYGTSGSVVTRLGTVGVFAFDSAVDSQGRLLVSGLASPEGFVARFLDNGAVDPSFGSGGMVRFPRVAGASTTSAVHVAIDGSQRIVVTLRDAPSTGTRIVRLTSTGSLDGSFGTGGIVQTSTSVDSGLAVSADGTITAAGSAGINMPGALRLTPSGTPDPTFGVNGVATLPSSTVLGVSSIDVDPDGRVVLGGMAVPTNSNAPAFAARLTASGQLDPTFGTGGIAVVGSGFQTSWQAFVVDATADGVVLAGSRFDNSAYDAFVAHLTAGGQVDSSFAPGGNLLLGLPGAVARTAIAQAGGKVVVGAPLSSGDGYVGRYVPGDVQPPAPLGGAQASGPFRVGQTVTFTDGDWVGTAPFVFHRTLELCGPCVAVIDDAHPPASLPLRYTLGLADVGAHLFYTVRAENSAGVTPSSVATPAVTADDDARQLFPGGFRAIGAPSIGSTLSLPSGSWTADGSVRFAYSWRRCPASGPCAALTAAGPPVPYTVQPADAGSTIVLVAHVQNAWTSFEITAPAIGPVPSGGSTGGGSTGGGSTGGGSTGGGGGGGSNLPDLEVTQVASRGQAAVGDLVTFTASVILKNFTASSGASNLVLTDVLPASLELVSVSTNRGSCVSGQTVVCNLNFIASGITAQVSITAKVVGAGEIVNTASVRADETELDPSNNVATVKLNSPVAAPAAPLAPPTVTKPAVAKGVTRTGTARPETLRGTARPDTLDGRGGNDTILGLGGGDLLIGGSGRDTIDAGAGNDTVRARDGEKDTVRCGAGVDSVIADRVDALVGCEKITRR